MRSRERGHHNVQEKKSGELIEMEVALLLKSIYTCASNMLEPKQASWGRVVVKDERMSTQVAKEESGGLSQHFQEQKQE